MPDNQATRPESLGLAGEYDPASAEFAELRELLLGKERRKLTELERRLDEPSRGAEELAEQLPEAIALRSGRDQRLARALAPTMESAISESVRRNPREIATAIFPVLGPAIRKALAEAMAALVDSINRAVEHTFSLRGLAWRLEAWRTGVPYAQIVLKHSLVYRVEQVFLIHAETGLLLVHAAPPDLAVTDADLISGMLTAIQDFVGDSFRQQEAGKLRSFSVGELTVIVEPGPQALLAAVVRGQPPESLVTKLQERLELIHLQFAAAFADFQGNTAPFIPALPLLADCLETVLSHHRSRATRSRLAPLRWALPILLLVGVLAVLAWRSNRRWNAAVARLEAEPGIEIVSARRGGGRWQFRGLKDPLAVEPALILAGLGADTSRLAARWEPYLSLEPSLVVARARQALAAPATVSFRVSRDSLIAGGEAPMLWVSRAAGLGMLPAGVGHLDLAGVTARLPATLEALKSQLEGWTVFFAVGSATLDQRERPVLDSVAAGFLQFRNALARLGYRADLEVQGRADPTGTDAINRSLSQSRIDAVVPILVRLGAPRERIRERPLGTGNPLPARSGADQAQANRSVVFQVLVVPEPGGAGESR